MTLGVIDRLTAFISGTQQDLNAERKAAAVALQRVGFRVLRAETAPSSAASSQSVCAQLARSCDLYVGIFGLRYGSTPCDLVMSVTEMEFEIAREADPSKILVFRQAGDPDARQQDFLTRVEDFTAGYFRSVRFDNPATLSKQVREAVEAWRSERVRRAARRRARARTAPVTRRPRRQDLFERRRQATEQDLVQYRASLSSAADPHERLSALKDVAASSNRVRLEQIPEVRNWIQDALKGRPALRVQALVTARTFLGVTEPALRENVQRWALRVSREQFDKTKELTVKAEALNLLSLVVAPEDLDRLIDHVLESPPELYDGCRPLYALDVLKHRAPVRQQLYAARRDTEDPEIQKRIDELLEYIRVEH